MLKECGARAKRNGLKPCRQYAVAGKTRCRFHGGLSTGPRTKEGLQRIIRANTKHGYYSKEAIQERREIRSMMREAIKVLRA